MDEDLVRRALAAYFRSENDGMAIVQQPANSSGVVEHADRTYVVLENVTGTLAVYRVRTSGQLKRLKRWPAEVATK